MAARSAAIRFLGFVSLTSMTTAITIATLDRKTEESGGAKYRHSLL
jgi:hypothetical protein